MMKCGFPMEETPGQVLFFLLCHSAKKGGICMQISFIYLIKKREETTKSRRLVWDFELWFHSTNFMSFHLFGDLFCISPLWNVQHRKYPFFGNLLVLLLATGSVRRWWLKVTRVCVCKRSVWIFCEYSGRGIIFLVKKGVWQSCCGTNRPASS